MSDVPGDDVPEYPGNGDRDDYSVRSRAVEPDEEMEEVC